VLLIFLAALYEGADFEGISFWVLLGAVVAVLLAMVLLAFVFEVFWRLCGSPSDPRSGPRGPL